jgi:hypothetical protein
VGGTIRPLTPDGIQEQDEPERARFVKHPEILITSKKELEALFAWFERLRSEETFTYHRA